MIERKEYMALLEKWRDKKVIKGLLASGDVANLLC